MRCCVVQFIVLDSCTILVELYGGSKLFDNHWLFLKSFPDVLSGISGAAISSDEFRLYFVRCIR